MDLAALRLWRGPYDGRQGWSMEPVSRASETSLILLPMGFLNPWCASQRKHNDYLRHWFRSVLVPTVGMQISPYDHFLPSSGASTCIGWYPSRMRLLAAVVGMLGRGRWQGSV